MRVLSLFDGMACGMLAMLGAGLKVDRYVAYEIDKYAVQTSSHNFPTIEHKGDVFAADFTQYKGFDFVVGGSPCTYWSIAQKNNRETEASGMGWELFSQYVRALHEAKPMYFIYENNKSMANAIRESITNTFGFEPICINSALVSAQNRQRLYWVGRRNEDGTYSKVKVEQPEDRGILLKDVLESGCAWKDKQGTIDANYYKGGNYSSPNKQSGQRMCVAEPVNITKDGKSRTLIAGYHKQGVENCCGFVGFGSSGVAEPVGIGYRGRMNDGKWVKQYESNGTEKANALTTAQTDSMIAEPVCASLIEQPHGRKKTEEGKYDRRFEARTDGKSNTLVATHAQQFGMVAVPVNTTDEGRCLQAGQGGLGVQTGLYAIPIEFVGEKPIKAISAADGKTYTVYQVKDGQITIKGKQYPIKLVDGFYIIRKLTVSECKRLQTVPASYEFPVSDTQAYKMLGNGWTVQVIVHLINATQTEHSEPVTPTYEQTTLF